MLDSVSWGDFLITMGLASVVYYSAIILVCYRKDISSIIRRLTDGKQTTIESETNFPPDYNETK